MNSLLEQRLLQELRHRQSRLFIPNCLAVAMALIFFWDFYSQSLFNCLPFITLITGLSLRFFVMQKFFAAYCEKKAWVHALFYFSVMLTGISWGVLFADSLQDEGLYTIHSLYMLGMILTSLSGTTTAFSSSVRNGAIFCVSAVSIPVLLLLEKSSSINVLGYLLLINCGYQIFHLTITHRYLRGTLQSEINSKFQTETLQEYIDAIPGIVGTVDMSATYTMVNNYMDGKIKKAILGTKVGSTLKNNPVSKLVLEFLKSPDEHWVREVHATDLAGENWYLINLKKIYSPHKGVLIAALPINDLVKTKNDLKIQEARSQYAAKLASLGEMSASIAHEINNPLAIIEGAASQLHESVRENLIDAERIDVIAHKISDTTQRIKKIVKSLKSLSKNADDEPFANIHFLSIVEPAKEISQQKLNEYNIDLRIVNHHEGIALFGNEIQLSQVILNLISNSIDAVKDLPERWIEIHYQPSYDWTDITVIDSGSGISEDIKSKIMNPFFTTKSNSDGTGLGLSISKTIIENHSGQLNLLEDKAHTTFQVRLPRMTEWRGA